MIFVFGHLEINVFTQRLCLQDPNAISTLKNWTRLPCEQRRFHNFLKEIYDQLVANKLL